MENLNGHEAANGGYSQGEGNLPFVYPIIDSSSLLRYYILEEKEMNLILSLKTYPFLPDLVPFSFDRLIG